MTWFEAVTEWILSNLNSIGLLVIGSFLTLFSSWFVARYTWKRQKDDEKRARVYAPLYDELSNLKHSLAKYGVLETKELRETFPLASIPAKRKEPMTGAKCILCLSQEQRPRYRG